MKKKLENKKIELEIKKLENENKAINKWLNPGVFLNLVILLIGSYSAFYLTRITDLKNERLEYDKKVLEYEIIEFTKKKDSITNSIDSLTIISQLFEDSISKLFEYNLYLNDGLLKKTQDFNNLIRSFNDLEESEKSSEAQIALLKDKLENLGMTDIKTLSFEAERKRISVGIYPNPAKDWIKIHVPNSKQKDTLEVRIYDITGKLKLSTNYISNSNEEIDIRSLKGAHYIVYFFNKTTHENIKVNLMKQ